MTVTAAFCPLSVAPIFDGNGRVVAGAKLYFYDSETTNLRTVYRDADLTLAHPSPVLADGYGFAPPIYVGVGAYKAVVKDANSAQLRVYDPLPGGTQPDPAPPPSATGWNTGDLKWSYSDSPQDGWQICNGRTIGNSTSGATGRADNDTQALFANLWNTNPDLVVSGGRGANATTDFEASKTIALPDARGRTLAGVDGMGNSLAGILTTDIFTHPDRVGDMAGAQEIVLSSSTVPTITTNVGNTALTVDQMPAHGHGINDGGHSHGVNDPGHSHIYHDALLHFIGAGGSGNVADQKNDSATTSSDGTGISIQSSGSNISTQDNGGGNPHNHSATSIANGTPSAHSNTQPTMLSYVFIKL